MPPQEQLNAGRMLLLRAGERQLAASGRDPIAPLTVRLLSPALPLPPCAALEDIAKMPYTRMAIAESMRLYPQPPILIRRRASSRGDGEEVNGCCSCCCCCLRKLCVCR